MKYLLSLLALCALCVQTQAGGRVVTVRTRTTFVNVGVSRGVGYHNFGFNRGYNFGFRYYRGYNLGFPGYSYSYYVPVDTYSGVGDPVPVIPPAPVDPPAPGPGPTPAPSCGGAGYSGGYSYSGDPGVYSGTYSGSYSRGTFFRGYSDPGFFRGSGFYRSGFYRSGFRGVGGGFTTKEVTRTTVKAGTGGRTTVRQRTVIKRR